MPKEIFTDAAKDSALQIEVAWGRDSSVSIATIITGDPTEEEMPGWFVRLNREGINRLIRVLRRARDQAYGADA